MDQYGERYKHEHLMKWTDKSIAEMRKYIANAKELYFLSTYANEMYTFIICMQFFHCKSSIFPRVIFRYELFPGIVSVFGNLFLLNDFDEVEDLSTLMCANKHAYFCNSTFRKLLSVRFTYDMPSVVEIQQMRNILMPLISKQLKLNEELNFICVFNIIYRFSLLCKKNCIKLVVLLIAGAMTKLDKLIAARRSKKPSDNQPSLITSSENVSIDTNSKIKRKPNLIRDIINAKKSAQPKSTIINAPEDKISNLKIWESKNVEINDAKINVDDSDKNMDSDRVNEIVNRLNKNYYNSIDSTIEIEEQKIDNYHSIFKKVLDDLPDVNINESVMKDENETPDSIIDEKDPELLLSDTEDDNDKFDIFYCNKKSSPKIRILSQNKNIPLNSFEKDQSFCKKNGGTETSDNYDNLFCAFDLINDLEMKNVAKSIESIATNICDNVDTEIVVNTRSKLNNVPNVDSKYSESEVVKILESFNDAPEPIRSMPSAPQPCQDNIENFIDDLCKPKLMIHSKYGKPPSLWPVLKSAYFTKFILNKLDDLKINTPTSSQKIVWPSVMRGRNTLLVGPANSGKTLGFLVPLCNLIYETDYDELPSSHGPIAWIVCPTHATAIFLEKTCRRLLADATNVSVLRIDNSADDGIIINSLLEGCTILISTPALLKFINRELNLERLLYLMFCDTDVLNERFYTEIEQIFSICMNRLHQDLKLQFIADSRTWCDLMSVFAHSVSNPLNVIDDFQEGLLCSKVSIKALFVDSSNKQTELKDYLDHLDIKKVIIMCESDDEILKIDDDIDHTKCHVFKVLNHMPLDKYIEVANHWRNYPNGSNQLILLVCDSGLINLNIDDAECLIHYSIPPMFSTFQRRFSTIVNKLTPTWIEGNNTPPHVTVFITEANQMQLPKLVNFLDRCGVKLDEKIMGMSESLKHLRDVQKAELSVHLCNELLSFGSCSDIRNCNSRHSIVPKFDGPEDWLPRSGFINFEIIQIHDVCHYSARLISYIKTDGTKVEMKQNYLDLAIKMSLYFAKEENKVPVTNMNPGDHCVAEIKTNQFSRCKIVKILSEDMSKKINVTVDLIDLNKKISIDSNSIFELPKQFQDVQNYMVQIRLVGIVPVDKDVVWSATDISKIKSLFSELGEQISMQGKIVLSLNHILWLDSVQCVQNLSICDQIAVRVNLKNYILDNNIGITNPNHLPSLYKICDAKLIELPNYNFCKKVQVKKPEEKLPDPQWAFIESDKFSEVYFSTGINPDKFYVRIVKWESCLKSLEKDIAKHVANFTKSVEDLSVDIGRYYLAKHSDGTFNRCRIDKIDCAETSVIEYTCFFVDYGDFGCVEKSDILPLTPRLITQLPFQAIECKLVGIKPISNEWDQSANDFMLEFCFDSEEGEVLKVLCAKEMYSEKAEITGGLKSAVFIFDPYSQSNESFNDLYISKNLGKILSADAHYLNESIEDMEKYLIEFSNRNCDDESLENDIVENNLFTDLNSYEAPENVYTDSMLDNFEIDDDFYSSDDDWDCTFTKEDFVNLKESTMKIVEVPNNTTSSNIDEYFGSNKQLEKISECDENIGVINVGENKLISKPVSVIEVPSHKTPFVRWSQTNDKIIVKIDLVGVDSYSMIINNASLIFECILKDTQYKLDLDLFGCVDKEKCSHTCHGLYVCVKLVKPWENIWPTLLKTTIKLPWLQYEFNDVDNDLEREEDDERNKIKKKQEILDLLKKADYEEGSDEDDDDFEIEGFIEILES